MERNRTSHTSTSNRRRLGRWVFTVAPCAAAAPAGPLPRSAISFSDSARAFSRFCWRRRAASASASVTAGTASFSTSVGACTTEPSARPRWLAGDDRPSSPPPATDAMIARNVPGDAVDLMRFFRTCSAGDGWPYEPSLHANAPHARPVSTQGVNTLPPPCCHVHCWQRAKTKRASREAVGVCAYLLTADVTGENGSRAAITAKIDRWI